MRDWAKHVGSVREAERRADVYRGTLHNWFVDPEAGLKPEITLKVSRASGCPVEALVYRWTPIKDLDFWKFLEVAK